MASIALPVSPAAGALLAGAELLVVLLLLLVLLVLLQAARASRPAVIKAARAGRWNVYKFISYLSGAMCLMNRGAGVNPTQAL